MLGGRQFLDPAFLQPRSLRLALDFFLDRKLALERHRFRRGLAHRFLQRLRPGIELRAADEDRPRDVKVAGQRVEGMIFVRAIGHGIGERIFLRVDLAGDDQRQRFGQIEPLRHGTEKLEGALLDLARQHADGHAGEIGGRAHRAQPVRDVAKAVLEPADDPVIAPCPRWLSSAWRRARHPLRRAPAPGSKTGTAGRRSQAPARGRSDSSTTDSRATARRFRPATGYPPSDSRTP